MQKSPKSRKKPQKKLKKINKIDNGAKVLTFAPLAYIFDCLFVFVYVGFSVLFYQKI